MEDISNILSTYEVIQGGRRTMHTLSEWCLVILSISVNYLPASVPLTSSEPVTLLIRTVRTPPQPPNPHTHTATHTHCHTRQQMDLLVWQLFIFRIKSQSYCPFPHLSFLLSSPLRSMPSGSQMVWLAYGYHQQLYVTFSLSDHTLHIISKSSSH